MEQDQKQQLDQAIQELRKAIHWRAELCTQIAKIIDSNPPPNLRINLSTHQIKSIDLPYQREAEQLEQAHELIARLMHQIQMMSMSPSVFEWQKQRNEIVSAEQMVIFAELDLLKPVMLNLDVLPFD